MTVINLFYATLPLLFSLILIARTGSVFKPMLYSAFLGLALYGVKIGFETMLIIGEPFSGFLLFTIAGKSAIQAVFEGGRLLRGILVDKAPIAVTVFALFFMVKLICSSRALPYINLAVNHFVKSRFRFLVILLGMSILFSIDDYLCCVGIATVVAGVADRQGFSREETAYMICLLSVAFCTLLPYSSWMPVVRSAVGITVPLYTVTLMNLAAFFAIFIVMADVLSGLTTDTRNQKDCALPNDFTKVFGVIIASAIVTAIVLITVNLFTDGTWSVTAAGIAGCVVMMALGIRSDVINIRNIAGNALEAFKDTGSLFKVLFFVWMTKDICIELLGMSNLLKAVMEMSDVPVLMIPAMIFIASSGFAYVTGTAFGAFSLFIPLALELTANSRFGLSSIAAAAALAGSLQSVNRPGSDVIRLTSDILKCDDKKLLKLQKNGMFYTIPILFTGFSLMGACAGYSVSIMFIAGIAPLLCYAGLRYLFNRKRKLAKTNESPIWGVADTDSPADHYYNEKYYTFHQRLMLLEELYASYLAGIRQKAKELSL